MGNPYTRASQYRVYDRYESRVGLYRHSSRRLVHMLPDTEGLVYDAGCGTGNSTLEVLRRFPKSRVLGIDDSKGMLAAAKAKFGLEDSSEIVKELLQTDPNLAIFLLRFIHETSKFRGQVSFRPSNLLEFQGEAADRVVAAHLLHWINSQELAVDKFAELLKPGGSIALSSSMTFYHLTKLHGEDVSFLVHPFVRHYLDILSKKLEEETTNPVHRRTETKKHPDETITLFESKGFERVSYDEIALPMIPVDSLLEYNLRAVPEHLGMFDNSSLSDETKSRLITDAIHETLLAHSDLIPNKGFPSDTNPLFVFRRK